MDWKLIDAVAELAVEAGNAILEIYNGDELGVSQN